MNRPAIPLSRCVKCTHYNGTMCVLEDLAPCQFRRTPEAGAVLAEFAGVLAAAGHRSRRDLSLYQLASIFGALLYCSASRRRSR